MAMNLTEIKDKVEIVSLVFVSVASVIAVIQYVSNAIDEKNRLINATYDGLDAQYVEFEKLCMQYPRTNCSDTPIRNAPKLEGDELARQESIYNIWASMIERAVRAKSNGGFKGHDDEWEEWEKYVHRFVQREEFKIFWENNKNEYPEYLRELICKHL